MSHLLVEKFHIYSWCSTSCSLWSKDSVVDSMGITWSLLSSILNNYECSWTLAPGIVRGNQHPQFTLQGWVIGIFIFKRAHGLILKCAHWVSEEFVVGCGRSIRTPYWLSGVCWVNKERKWGSSWHVGLAFCEVVEWLDWLGMCVCVAGLAGMVDCLQRVSIRFCCRWY